MNRKDKDLDYEIPEQLDWSNARRGAIVPTPPWKTRITIRIDTEILDWFRKQVNKAGGGNYQTLMNNALREHITRREGTLAQTLRQVLREELARPTAPRKRKGGTRSTRGARWIAERLRKRSGRRKRR